jgi:hypothetical protein
MLSRDDYRLIEINLNNKQFLQLLDADNTKAGIYYIRQKFMVLNYAGLDVLERVAGCIQLGAEC